MWGHKITRRQTQPPTISVSNETLPNLDVYTSTEVLALAKTYTWLEASEFETKEEYEEHYDYDVERIAQKVSTAIFNHPNPTPINRAEIIAALSHLMVDDLDDAELVEMFICNQFDYMEQVVDEDFAERGLGDEEEEEEQEPDLIAGGGLPEQWMRGWLIVLFSGWLSCF